MSDFQIIKEPQQAYIASSPTSERTLVYVSSEPKIQYDHGLPPPVTYKERERKRSVWCTKSCMWAIIVLCVVLGISLAVSLAVVLT